MQNYSGTVYDPNNDIFTNSYINGSTILDGPGYTSKYSSSYSIIKESDIENYTGRYACAVLALTEIAGQEGILVSVHTNTADNIRDTFLALWVYTNTYVDHITNSILYGFTYDSDLSSGMSTYCTIRGKNNTTITTQANPSYWKCALCGETVQVTYYNSSVYHEYNH